MLHVLEQQPFPFGRLLAENLLLKQQLAAYRRRGARPVIGIWDRLLWILLARVWHGWRDALFFVQPATVIGWHRAGVRALWRRRSRHGRKRTTREMRRLIQRMADENPTWGAPRIHGELMHLGFRVSERTVSRILARIRRTGPPGKAGQSWATFLQNHREFIAAMDFFSVPTWCGKWLTVLVFLHHDRRRILHVRVCQSQDAPFLIHQLREAFPYDESPRWLLFDRDSRFSARVRGAIQAMGIEPKQTAFRSPWQNGAVERLIGSMKRELLDHVIIRDEHHLERLLREYVAYYHDDRTHLGLG